MDSLFCYVWQHFQSIYQVPEGLQVGYGPAGQGPVRISRQAGDFFSQQSPWPTDIAWQEWQGQALPLLFASRADLPLLSQQPGYIQVNYDLIAGAFYFLSGWQEYKAPDRDRHGRFPFQSSLQYQLGCIQVPVVNYYFDILKTAIEKATGLHLAKRFNPESAFTVLLTHDVDNTESGWKEEAKDAWYQGDIGRVLQAVINRLRGRDPWFNWQDIAGRIAACGGVSTFFFLGEHKSYKGTANADFAVEKKKYREAIKALAAGGAEIAVHGSLESAVSTGKLRQEMGKLPLQVQGNRFHYLRFEPRTTPALLDAAGLAYDSSLGFAEHFGFRHGYCFPFRLYNFKENKPYAFLEIPLVLMDATLHHPHYLQLNPGEVLPALQPVLAELEKFQGCFTLLWHNENFTEHKKTNGLAVFQQLMEELNQRGATFRTASQVCQQFRFLFGND
ncbi:MAG: polysaccharide deacetylase family protein [Adhaeribacter sp.]